MPVQPPPRRLPKEIQESKGLYPFFHELLNSIYQLFVFAAEFGASGTQSITAAGGVTYIKRITRVVGSGGSVTVTATPSIAAIEDGKEIIIQGTHDTNTVVLQDESGLANSGLALAGGANFTLGKGDTLHLTYSAVDSKYYEIARSNN